MTTPPSSESLPAPGAPRDAHIDALRGIAITLIVVVHLQWAYTSYTAGAGLAPTFAGVWDDPSKLGTFWQWADRLSAPICVTLFAFISGYLLAMSSARTFTAFARGRLLSLGLPFLAWGVAYWLDPQSNAFFLHKGGLSHFLLASVWQPVGAVIGPIWFLPVLLLASAIVFTVRQVSKGQAALVICAGVAILLPRLLGILGIEFVPFGIAQALAYVPFVAAGAFVRNYGPIRWQGSWWRLTASTLGYAACWAVQLGTAEPLSRQSASWRIPSLLTQEVLSLALMTAGIWMCIELVAALPQQALAPVAWLGVNSLGVCGAHLPVIVLLVSLGIRSPWWDFPATLALCAALSWLLGRNAMTRLAFLGGRARVSAATPG